MADEPRMQERTKSEKPVISISQVRILNWALHSDPELVSIVDIKQ
jgi:hypothetical protein